MTTGDLMDEFQAALDADLAAGLTYGHQLWFGTPRNIGTRLAQIAEDLHSANKEERDRLIEMAVLVTGVEGRRRRGHW